MDRQTTERLCSVLDDPDLRDSVLLGWFAGESAQLLVPSAGLQIKRGLFALSNCWGAIPGTIQVGSSNPVSWKDRENWSWLKVIGLAINNFYMQDLGLSRSWGWGLVPIIVFLVMSSSCRVVWGSKPMKSEKQFERLPSSEVRAIEMSPLRPWVWFHPVGL